MNFNGFRDQALRNAEKVGQRWIYRGHASRAWKLESSYSRFYTKAFGGSAAFSMGPFERMLGRFVRRASEATGEDYERYSLFQRMALAQHYGVPTPLLDWSHSPYVAAYFAVADAQTLDDEVTFCVYAINVGDADEPSPEEAANFRPGHSRPFLFVDTKSFFSRRIMRQSGCFTYHSFGGCLQDWQSSQPAKVIELNAYDVAGRRSRIMRELELMSITGGSLFDDLDYVAKDVVNGELMDKRNPAE